MVSFCEDWIAKLDTSTKFFYTIYLKVNGFKPQFREGGLVKECFEHLTFFTSPRPSPSPKSKPKLNKNKGKGEFGLLAVTKI